MSHHELSEPPQFHLWNQNNYDTGHYHNHGGHLHGQWSKGMVLLDISASFDTLSILLSVSGITFSLFQSHLPTLKDAELHFTRASAVMICPKDPCLVHIYSPLKLKWSANMKMTSALQQKTSHWFPSHITCQLPAGNKKTWISAKLLKLVNRTRLKAASPLAERGLMVTLSGWWWFFKHIPWNL